MCIPFCHKYEIVSTAVIKRVDVANGDTVPWEVISTFMMKCSKCGKIKIFECEGDHLK